jgi:hypothetical protein
MRLGGAVSQGTAAEGQAMLGLIFVFVIDTAVLMIIISMMEEEAFENWPRILVCSLAMSMSMGIASSVLPGLWALLGHAVAAGVGGLVISALCGMSVKRAAIAAAIFWGYKIALSLICLGMYAGMSTGTKS